MFNSERRTRSNFDAILFQDEIFNSVKHRNCSIKDLDNPNGIPYTDESWSPSTTVTLPRGIEGPLLSIRTGAQYDMLRVTAVNISPYWDRSADINEYRGVDAPLGDASVVVASLEIQFTDSRSPLVKRPIRIPLYLELDRTNKTIIGCKSYDQGQDLQAFCNSIGGEWDFALNSCDLPCPAGHSKSDGICFPSDLKEITCDLHDKCEAGSTFVVN